MALTINGVTFTGRSKAGSGAPAPSYIATPTATPGTFGSSFEGGYYAGIIWNQLVQTSSSKTIGTGSTDFAVPDMSVTPIVYLGQTLEIRSRANPLNKMVGVVTFAGGTLLTVNVTSVGGSGTFSDWSIMSQYRIIVSPKSTGESIKAYKNADTASPAYCDSVTEGRLATLAMVADGNATVYPAAHFCNNLSISGYTDWFMPARDELELSWRNLKPASVSNYTGTRGGSFSAYLGSYADTSNNSGENLNSVPQGAAYTSGSPAQCASGINFRTGESQAYEYSSYNYYWSSTQISAGASGIYQFFGPEMAGVNFGYAKSNAIYVRAVRRSII